MGPLKDILSAAARLVSNRIPQGRSYLVVLDKEGAERRILMDKYYTPENPPPKNILEIPPMEYAVRLTP